MLRLNDVSKANSECPGQATSGRGFIMRVYIICKVLTLSLEAPGIDWTDSVGPGSTSAVIRTKNFTHTQEASWKILHNIASKTGVLLLPGEQILSFTLWKHAYSNI